MQAATKDMQLQRLSLRVGMGVSMGPGPGGRDGVLAVTDAGD